VDNATGQTVQSGTIVSDADGLVVLPRVQIGTGAGNRLILTVETVLTGPAATTTSLTPQIQWSPGGGAVSYDVWITNLSTGQNPAVQANVPTNSYIPANPLGIGRFRVWVRSRFAGGAAAPWSSPRDFQVVTAPTFDDQSVPSYSGTPLISWGSLPGAAKYDLWINNKTTGQSQVIRRTSLTTNSYQVTANLGLGTYQAWVRGIDAANNAGQWSSTLQFTSAARVTLTSPASPTFSTRPNFVWAAVPGANRYQITVQNRGSNATVIDQSNIVTSNWTPGAALPNGDYRWWARAFSASGIIGGWSVPMDFSIGGKPVVQTPAGTTSDRTPTFSWTAVQGAARYELWVAGLDGSGVAINLTNLTTNSYTPAADLAPRTYRIWVRAVSTTNVISAWSAPVDITITKVNTSLPPLEGLLGVTLTGLSSDNDTKKPASSENGMPESLTDEYPAVATPAVETVAEQTDAIDRVMADWLLI
jgi:hypothetical protein